MFTVLTCTNFYILYVYSNYSIYSTFVYFPNPYILTVTKWHGMYCLSFASVIWPNNAYSPGISCLSSSPSLSSSLLSSTVCNSLLNHSELWIGDDPYQMLHTCCSSLRGIHYRPFPAIWDKLPFCQRQATHKPMWGYVGTFANGWYGTDPQNASVDD